MYGKFLVEGDKLVRELLASNFKIEAIFGLEGWNTGLRGKKIDFVNVSEAELRKISTHENPNQVLAVAEIPQASKDCKMKLPEALYLVCDDLSDPGNVGTMIRTADWFGIKQVFLSENSVDIYNPKVVSAAKGSLFRVACTYVDLKQLFGENKHLPVYGTFMAGENIYRAQLDKQGFILVGNEANGISGDLVPFVQHRLSIPAHGNAESLNAAVAAGVVMGEFKRRLD